MNRKELKMLYPKIVIQNFPQKSKAMCEYKNRNLNKLHVNNIKQSNAILSELSQGSIDQKDNQ